jgi:hypothetical protein
MKLYVLSDYQCRNLDYKKGQEIEVSDFLGRFLLVDSPGSFSQEPPEKPKPAPKRRRKAPSKPAKDKAVKAPAAKK